MDPKVQFIDDIKPLQDTELYRVRGVEGVQWAVPLYKGLLKARLDNGTFQTCNVLGLDDATPDRRAADDARRASWRTCAGPTRDRRRGRGGDKLAHAGPDGKTDPAEGRRHAGAERSPRRSWSASARCRGRFSRSRSSTRPTAGRRCSRRASASCCRSCW